MRIGVVILLEVGDIVTLLLMIVQVMSVQLMSIGAVIRNPSVRM